MTRIVAGAHGGRRIAVPSGGGTRPTADRVREALFTSLGSALAGGLDGCRFLDLYAGSGAVALEAASRGAGHVTAVESDPRALRVLQANARLLGVAVEVVPLAVERAVAAGVPVPYDVVFADPPYATPSVTVRDALRAALRHGWVAPAGVVVVERSRHEHDWEWPEGLQADRERGYGDTVLRYARRS